MLPCDIPYCNNDSELIVDKLTDLLGKEKKNVVAWFKYKKHRRSGYRFSLREKILHEELAEYLAIPPHQFTCLILSYDTNDTKSTHIFRHAFIQHSENQYRIVPMNIENLSNPCHQYQINTKPSEDFMQLYSKINKKQSDLQIGADIHKQLQSELKKLIKSLVKSENELSSLRNEVETLTRKLHEKEVEENLAEDEKIENSLMELEIEVPEEFEYTPDDVDEAINDKEENREDVVDLTLTDEEIEEERPVRKVKTPMQQKSKTNKSKKRQA